MLSRFRNNSKSGYPGGLRALRVRLLLAGAALFVALTVAGCTSGSYPVDIFYEQHYQQSYKSHEPPRLAGVEGAAAFFPAPLNTTDDSGKHLYEINCQMCHGDDGKDSGPVLQRLIMSPEAGGYGYQYAVLNPETLEPRPPDLTTVDPEDIDGYLRFRGDNPGVLPGNRIVGRFFGPESVMPPFGRLLSEAERQAIIQHIDTLP